MAFMLPDDKLPDRIHYMLLRHELARVDWANAYAFFKDVPFTDAANLLSDVPECLAVMADLNLLATGPDFLIR